MATERAVIGQAQRVLVDATNKIWHKISTWTHASDVEMPDGEPLNEYLINLNDSINERFDDKYNSYNFGTTAIGSLDAIPEIGYSRIQTIQNITAGDYTIPINHTCYCYSGQDSASIEKMVVMIDTTDLTSIVMYIAHYSREARWTLTKIATQKQIDNLQMQIDELNNAFNQLNLFVNQSVGDLNARYQIIQDQMDWLEAELAELQEFLNDLLNELRDFKAETRGRLDEIDAKLGYLYQIGAIYITSTYMGATAKRWLEKYFGGTWILIQNAYLYATGTDLSYTGQGSPGCTSNKTIVPTNAGDYLDDSGSYDKFSRTYFESFGEDADYAREMGWDYDYSKSFHGRDEFILDKTNLPEHNHKVAHGPHGYDQMPYFVGRNLIGTAEVAKDFPVHPDYENDSDYAGIMFNKRNLRLTSGNSGVSFWEDAVGTNKFPDEELYQPIALNPTRFYVCVWMRIK